MRAVKSPICLSAPAHLEDEINLLVLQLNEIDSDHGIQKGKHPMHSPPDTVLAYEEFRSEIQARLDYLRDSVIAHSMARAVDTDAQAIRDITLKDSQINQDWLLAQRIRAADSDSDSLCTEAPPPYTETDASGYLQAKYGIHVTFDDPRTDDSDDLRDFAGPSSYTKRQRKQLDTLSSKQYQCCVCLDQYHEHKTVHLPCKHCYCNHCLEGLLLRAIKDHTLFPPRCCRINIPSSLIARALSPPMLEEFRATEVEYYTEDRTYCTGCGKFIPPKNIFSGKATCDGCGSKTCSLCKK